MQVTCTQCHTKFNLEEHNLPTQAFNVNCPNCRFTLTVNPPPKVDPALPASARPGPGPAAASEAPAGNDAVAQLVALLSSAMGLNASRAADGSAAPASWQRRHAIICMADAESIRKMQSQLDTAHFELTVCEAATRAVEIMRDIRVDIVILDPQFDANNQGGITVLRHVSSMMPKYRRRIYLVLVSPQIKTLDTYMAFLNGVNLTVNSADLDTFRDVLDRSIRDFNELYRPYNAAAGLSPF
ncbi:MAG: zinc-ribbon domain-containing protein [Acidobacteria bacterium]|nr:zinc-ribbon domain-containing protein [Acidobacteriota bacterium]